MKRRRWKAILAVSMASSMTIQTFAAGWIKNEDNTWSYLTEDNTKLANTWKQDQDGLWYHLDQNGIMQTGWIIDETGNKYFLNRNVGDPQGSLVSGWKLIDNIWYFFNINHDGTYGKVLTGWQWIDGYCYYFDNEGKMAVNTTTPDGYTVNENGAWVENGKAVYQSGKGYITKTTSSGVSTGKVSSGGSSSGGGGGGGGGGGSHSSGSHTNTTTTYSYTVNCFDEEGNLLKTYSLSGKKGTTLTFSYQIDGYELMSGDSTPELTENNQIFNLFYRKKKEEIKPNTPEKQTYTYTIRYVDVNSGEVLDTVTGKNEENKTITIEKKSFEGYESVNNDWTFVLSGNINKIVYYQKKAVEKNTYHYTIKYICGKTILGTIESSAEENSIIEIKHRNFNGYEIEKNQKTEFTLNADNMEILIHYKEKENIATPSEPEKETYKYTVKCIDFNTDEVIATYNETGEIDSEINPDYEIDGYTIMDEYSFILEKDNSVFEIYYTKDEEETLNYTVKCIDFATKDELASYSGTGKYGDQIIINHEIEGYTLMDDEPVELNENNQKIIVNYIKNEKQYTFTIYQIDIDSNEVLGTVERTGEVGTEVDFTNLELEDYELLGVPDGVKYSALESNNQAKVYYKKITNINPDKKEVSYTVRFISHSDSSKEIYKSYTGYGVDGDKVPVYFPKQIVMSDGSVWRAVDGSPATFTLDATRVNTFSITYINVGKQEDADKILYDYSIKYIASDTGATLGISTGYAYEGDKITFRNTFNDYGFSSDQNYMIISSDTEENDIEVEYTRIAYPGPEKDQITGEYIMNSWSVYFRDDQGNSLLPPVNGKSLKNTKLVIDYPDIIELGDGTTYRAEYESPYMEVQEGTTYKQIVIKYTKGDLSNNLLEKWKKIAQEAKTDFNKTTPYDYKIVYREKNSWNDIGLYVGVNTIDSYVTIPLIDITDYTVPDEALGGFTIKEKGQVTYTDYNKYSSGSSLKDSKLTYKINFKDEDGNDVFSPYTGTIAYKNVLEGYTLPVYFPKEFTDIDGNIWVAEESSPKLCKIEKINANDNEYTIYYRKSYNNPMNDLIVTNEKEALSIYRSFFTYTSDTEQHTFYIIGKDYDPKLTGIGDLQATYDVNQYGNATVDQFEINGSIYYVSKVTFTRTFTKEQCKDHKYEVIEKSEGTCLSSGRETLRCSICKDEFSVIIPATGHVDDNHDTVCDKCGKRFFPSNIGDEMIVNWDSGSLGLGTYQFSFICIDDNYKNTGKMLYMCVDDIPSELYGKYSHSNTANYNTSDLKEFLNDEFLDGLGSLRLAAQNLDDGRVSILTKEECDTYKKNASNQYDFPDDEFITASSNNEKVILSTGREVTAEEANNYSVKPIILLEKPDSSETVQLTTWKKGDLQVRTIGNKAYLFRCIDENYQDKTNTGKRKALFLCESVIPADIIDNENTSEIETMYFGDTNNYKYSTINQWLKANSTDSLFSLSKINIGVDSTYSGSTKLYEFSQLEANELTKTEREKTQVMYGNMFILSVEEALQYKDYLWKFDRSEEENPETQERQFCSGYWLRTPETGTEDKIYSVNLLNGNIEPVSCKATTDNDYSRIGIRPAFVMPQNE